jgi:hypothetical protein
LTLHPAARTMPRRDFVFMARFFITLLALGWLVAGAQASNILPRSNIVPLTFGMTPDEASAALGAPLVYVTGKHGAEVFVAQRNAGVPGLYPVGERLFLQFRRGGLAGWKTDWAVTRPFWLF